MNLNGKAWKVGDHIDTDVIIPARYLNTSDPIELAKYCMIDYDQDFVTKIKAGDMMVAGVNFGCGSSREHAPSRSKWPELVATSQKHLHEYFIETTSILGFPFSKVPRQVKKYRQVMR